MHRVKAYIANGQIKNMFDPDPEKKYIPSKRLHSQKTDDDPEQMSGMQMASRKVLSPNKSKECCQLFWLMILQLITSNLLENKCIQKNVGKRAMMMTATLILLLTQTLITQPFSEGINTPWNPIFLGDMFNFAASKAKYGFKLVVIVARLKLFLLILPAHRCNRHGTNLAPLRLKLSH